MTAGEWLLVAVAPLAVLAAIVVLFVAPLRQLDVTSQLRGRREPSEIRAYLSPVRLLSRSDAGGRAVSAAGRHRAEETTDALSRGPSARPVPPRPTPHGVIACTACGGEWIAPPGGDPATELVEHMRTRHAGDERGVTP